MNSSENLGGRLGNHIIRNVYLSFLAESGNLQFKYGYFEHIKKLGIPLFTTGIKTYEKTVTITDDVANSYLDKTVDFNIKVDGYIQNPYFSNRLYNYFRTETIKESIQNANLYKDRYGNNDDVYVHIRLDDATRWNPGFSYYDNAIRACGAKTGFISSDDPDHKIVRMISEKYGFPIIKTDKDRITYHATSMEAVDTIMLATTCKYLILSHGTFSWVIGALAFYSEKICIPPLRFINDCSKTNFWVGDIYNIESWEIVEP